MKEISRYTQNKSGVFLPFDLVESAIGQDLLNSLPLFVSLKKCYRNGVFFSYSSRRLAHQLKGYSHTTINYHINVLYNEGLIEKRLGKNGKIQLILKGYQSLTKKWGRRVVFIKHGSKSEIKEQLLAQRVILNIKRQEYCIGKKQGRNRKLEKIVESAKNYASLSNRHLAKILGVSTAKAHALKKNWSTSGIITAKPMWRVLAVGISEDFYKQSKAFGYLPPWAVYQKKEKRILERMPDAVFVGNDNSYKSSVYSWEPSFISTRVGAKEGKAST